MRVLVIGAGRVGMRVMRQLQKNPEIEIIVADAHARPRAVEEGMIAAVDIQEALSPLTMEYIVSKADPGMILLTQTGVDLGLGSAPGMGMFADALRDELASIADVPVILVR